jgi:hypothetical protein
MIRVVLLTLAAASAMTFTAPAIAHGGGLNAQGCHNDRQNGGYHCHRGPAAGQSAPAPNPYGNNLAPNNYRSGGASFANCSEARAAGAAPVRRGDPGYSSKLDRDGDGVGCE